MTNLNMKKTIAISLLINILLLGCINNASAISIAWTAESITLREGKEGCITYNTYNPSQKDINIMMNIQGRLREILPDTPLETKLVPANTDRNNPVYITYCFKVLNVYQKDCLLGNFLCKQSCTEEEKEYQGEIVMAEKAGSEIAQTGSTTSIVAGAPLRIKVTCEPYNRNWALLYIIIFIIAVVFIVQWLFRKY